MADNYKNFTPGANTPDTFTNPDAVVNPTPQQAPASPSQEVIPKAPQIIAPNEVPWATQGSTQGNIPPETNYIHPDLLPWSKQQSLVPEPTKGLPLTNNESILDSIKSFGRGALKGAATYLDSTVQAAMPDEMRNSVESQTANAKERGKEPPLKYPLTTYAQENLTPADSQLKAALEGAGSGAVGGMTMGPAGILPGAAGGSMLDWRMAADPDHPKSALLWSLIASLGAPTAANAIYKPGKLLTEGAGLTDRPEIIQAAKDQGVTIPTVAALGDRGWDRWLRGMRESLFGGNKINEKEANSAEQLGSAVNNQADTLGTAETKEQAGTALRTGAEEYAGKQPLIQGQPISPYDQKRILGQGYNSLNAAVDPSKQMINMNPVVDELIDKLGAVKGAEKTTEGLVPGGENLVDDIIQDVSNYTSKSGASSSVMPLDALQSVKRMLSDKMEDAIMSGSDASKRQITLANGILTGAERQFYQGTPYAQQFEDLQNGWKNYYTNMEKNIAPILDKNHPEEGLNHLLAQKGSGGSRIDETLNSLDPGVRGNVASYYLRNMGADAKAPGGFSPAKYFNEWNTNTKLSPEAKLALFGNDPQAVKAMDQLSSLSDNLAKSQAARNSSGTAGAGEVLGFMRRATNAVGPAIGMTAAGSGVGAGAQYLGSDNDKINATNGAMGGIGLWALASYAGPRLMTNPIFIRWLATDGIKTPASTRVLAGIAGDYPQLAPDLQRFDEKVKDQSSQMGPSSDTPHFAKGGQVGDNESLLDKIGRLQQLEEENSQPVAPPSGDFYQRLLPKDPVKDDPKGMAAGGEVNADDPVSLSISSKPSYAEGDRIPPTQQWLDSRSGYGQEVLNNTDIPHREDELNSAVWGHRDTEENNYPRDEQSILGRFMLPPPRHEKFDFAKEIENADRDYNLANPPSWHNWGGMASGGLADSPFLDSEWSANLNRPYTANDSTELRPSMPAYSLDPRVSILDNILPMRANDNSYAEGGEVKNKLLSLGELQQLAENAGFRGQSAKLMAAISMAESSGNPNARARNDGGTGYDSYGLTQVLGIHPGAEKALGNPEEAFKLAYKISNEGKDFTPWSMYKNGGYKKYINGSEDFRQSGSPTALASNNKSSDTPSSTPFDNSDTQPNTDENQEAILNNNDDDERTANFDNVIQNQDWIEPTTKLAAHEILRG